MGGLSSPPQLSIICASGSSHLRNGVLMWPIQVMTLLFSLKPKTTRRKKLSPITGSLAPYVQAKTHFKLACLVPKLFNNRHWMSQPKYEMFVSAQSFRSVYFVTLTRRWIRLWSVKFVPFPTNWILMSSAECLCSEECCHVVVQMNKLRVDDTGEIWSFAHIVLTWGKLNITIQKYVHLCNLGTTSSMHDMYPHTRINSVVHSSKHKVLDYIADPYCAP